MIEKKYVEQAEELLNEPKSQELVQQHGSKVVLLALVLKILEQKGKPAKR